MNDDLAALRQAVIAQTSTFDEIVPVADATEAAKELVQRCDGQILSIRTTTQYRIVNVVTYPDYDNPDVDHFTSFVSRIK